VWDVLAQHHEARFFTFATLTDALEERLATELSAIGSVITESTISVRRLDHMTPLTERKAGWVLKPLHD
jgi:hypothetical protein